MSNALLTWPGALGYVTELISGDYATAFGRSSHHQVWSEAMVVAPVLKGLFGIDADEAGGTLRFAPRASRDMGPRRGDQRADGHHEIRPVAAAQPRRDDRADLPRGRAMPPGIRIASWSRRHSPRTRGSAA